MIYLDELRSFDEDMNADEKCEAILDYLKGMKDSYEAYLKSLEQRVGALETD